MKLRITIYGILALFGTMILGAPNQVEVIINNLFLIANFRVLTVSFSQTFLTTSLGVIMFIISCVGVFEGHKISLGFINTYNKHINILHQFANHSGIFILLFIATLITNVYFKNDLTKNQVLTIIYDSSIVCYLYLLFVVVKSLIFEPIYDNLQVSKRLEDFGSSTYLLD
jgi:hypothetical protein